MGKDAQTQLRNEECRQCTLGYLADRQGLAFRPEAIQRGLKRDLAADFTLEEVQAALTFLEGLKLVLHVVEKLGATKSWQATSEGVLEHERSGQ